MGLYDIVELSDERELPGFDGDPSNVEWQTKTFRPCTRTKFRITAEGELLEENWHYETRPQEARPSTDGDSDAERRLHEAFGVRERVHDCWQQRQYHGIFEFHASVDDSLLRYEAKFTDGQLMEIRRS